MEACGTGGLYLGTRSGLDGGARRELKSTTGAAILSFHCPMVGRYLSYLVLSGGTVT